MAYPILARRDEALDPAETTKRLRTLLGAEVLVDTRDEFGTFTVRVAPADWVATLTALRDDTHLAYDMFDCLFGVDRGEAGFDVVAILYSTSKGRRIVAVTRADGGRETPECPSAVEVFRGVDFMEREAWDMFGIEFPGHPQLAPRLLCVENFEGWPLRKDFYLVSREVKPWPGIKEPAELDEDGNVIVKVPGPGEAPGPSGLDELMAAQAKLANADETGEVEAQQAQQDTPKRAEVEIDQETYDALIAEGKSERVARSKAKRAAMKKAEAAADDPAASGDGSDDVADALTPSAEQLEAAEATPAGAGPTAEDQAAAEVEEVVASDAVAAEATAYPTNDDGDAFDQAVYDTEIGKGKPERVAMSKAKRAAAKAPAGATTAPQADGQSGSATPPAPAGEGGGVEATATVDAGDDTPEGTVGEPVDDAGAGDDPQAGEAVVGHDDDGNPYDQATYDAEIAKGKPERVAMSKARRAHARGASTSSSDAADRADEQRQAAADARAAKAAERDAEDTPPPSSDVPSIPEGRLHDDEQTADEPAPVEPSPDDTSTAAHPGDVDATADAPTTGGQPKAAVEGAGDVDVATTDDGDEYDRVTYDAEIAKGKPERVALSKAKRALAKHRRDS